MRNGDWWGDGKQLEEQGLLILAAIVKTQRLATGTSQRQLAWRVGVNQSTISRVETGSLRTVRMSTYARMIAVLRVPRSIVFDGEPPLPTRRLPGEPRRPKRASPKLAQPAPTDGAVVRTEPSEHVHMYAKDIAAEEGGPA